MRSLRKLSRFYKRIMKKIKNHQVNLIRIFADTYGLCLPNAVLFDASSLFGLQYYSSIDKSKWRFWMSEKKIGFTVACVNEFAQHHNLSIQEAFRYPFQFKGIAFIKENYEVEHTLDFETIIEDLGILCRKNGGVL